MARFIREHAPKDARQQWQKVAAADELAFIAPVFWLHFPAILKGWFERVFAYGSAYELTREGGEGHASGRVPLMHHTKALIMTPTLFCEADYKADWEEPMRRIIDDWGLRYPGVKHVEHVYFYGAAIADPPQIQEYLREARRLGREFAVPAAAGTTARSEVRRIDGSCYEGYRRVRTMIADMSTSLPILPGPPAASCCAPAAGLNPALDAGRIATVAKALSEPLRVNVVDVLRRSPEAVCQCELIALFDVKQSLFSHHMRKLVDSGLVDVQRRHRWAYYSISPDAAKELSTWLS